MSSRCPARIQQSMREKDRLDGRGLTRRELLKYGAALGGAEVAASLLGGCGVIGSKNLPTATSACSSVNAIDHVVIVLLENRSFDHYFGTYPGVRGFNDKSAAFQQPYPANTSSSPSGVLLPFHLDSTKLNAACTHDITHDW